MGPLQKSFGRQTPDKAALLLTKQTLLASKMGQVPGSVKDDCESRARPGTEGPSAETQCFVGESHSDDCVQAVILPSLSFLFCKMKMEVILGLMRWLSG